jgi:adenylate cyclase
LPLPAAHRFQAEATAGAPPEAAPTLPKPIAPPLAQSTPAGLPLPDKPSIAILPFTNIGGGQEEEYCSDGMAEDIITALSRSRALFVMARNSSFTFKARTVDVKPAARELGVRYVPEGSVRRGGDRVCVSAQLIDAESGNQFGPSDTIATWRTHSLFRTRSPPPWCWRSVR